MDLEGPSEPFAPLPDLASDGGFLDLAEDFVGLADCFDFTISQGGYGAWIQAY